MIRSMACRKIESGNKLKIVGYLPNPGEVDCMAVLDAARREFDAEVYLPSIISVKKKSMVFRRYLSMADLHVILYY